MRPTQRRVHVSRLWCQTLSVLHLTRKNSFCSEGLVHSCLHKKYKDIQHLWRGHWHDGWGTIGNISKDLFDFLIPENIIVNEGSIDSLQSTIPSLHFHRYDSIWEKKKPSRKAFQNLSTLQIQFLPRVFFRKCFLFLNHSWQIYCMNLQILLTISYFTAFFLTHWCL